MNFPFIIILLLLFLVFFVSVSFHPHFTIRIFSSAFSIRILSSAFFHPSSVIRHPPSAIRHPPSAAIRSAFYRDPLEKACKFCKATIIRKRTRQFPCELTPTPTRPTYTLYELPAKIKLFLSFGVAVNSLLSITS